MRSILNDASASAAVTWRHSARKHTNPPDTMNKQWEEQLEMVAKAIRSGGKIGVVVEAGEKADYWRKRIPELVPGVQKVSDGKLTKNAVALTYRLHNSKPANN